MITKGLFDIAGALDQDNPDSRFQDFVDMKNRTFDIYLGGALEQLKRIESGTVNTCITSPPYYGLRDYGVDGQIGLENTPEEYIQKLVDVFREVKRVLRDDGTLWVNIGDSYNGSGGGHEPSLHSGFQAKSYEQKHEQRRYISTCKPKDLIGIPWMLAFALRNDGWYLRQDIIWAKQNCMPESVKDRCTKSHEYIFLLSKSSKYYFDTDAMMELATGYDGRRDTVHKGSEKYSTSEYLAYGTNNTMASSGHERWKFSEGVPVRNKRDVWNVAVNNSSEAHFATFPKELITPCVLAGCPKNGVVLDPFNGSGTTGIVAVDNCRNYIGIELNPDYIEITKRRVLKECYNMEVVVK